MGDIPVRPDAILADPYYRGEIASFIKESVLELTHYEIVADPAVRRLIEVDTREHLIKVQPGRGLRDFHVMADRACLYVVGGPAWAPEFIPGPRLQGVPDMPDLKRFKPVNPSAVACPACLRVVGG